MTPGFKKLENKLVANKFWMIQLINRFNRFKHELHAVQSTSTTLTIGHP
jgi:hypothetical protein